MFCKTAKPVMAFAAETRSEVMLVASMNVLVKLETQASTGKVVTLYFFDWGRLLSAPFTFATNAIVIS